LGARERELLAEAAEWRLLGLLFEYPAAGWREEVLRLGAEARDARLGELAAAAAGEMSEGLHQALFGPAGPVPLREVTYLGGVQLGYLMSELAAYYNAFGYQNADREADDHLAVEAGFVAFLKLKQAYALASGMPEQAAIAEEAMRSFIADHLCRLAHGAGQRLEAGGPDAYAAAGRALAERTGPAPAASGYPLGEDDEEMSCGQPGAAAGETLYNLG
jgi:nitrate reductase assembly molybdenum cofactor insertion protein NarJ